MIPSVIGAQVRRGIEEFLRTTFPITNPWFEGALDRMLARKGEVFRGPYLSLRCLSPRPVREEVLSWGTAIRVQTIPASGNAVGSS